MTYWVWVWVWLGIAITLNKGVAGELFGFPTAECEGMLNQLRNRNDQDIDVVLHGILADYVEDHGDVERADLIRTDLELMPLTVTGGFRSYPPYYDSRYPVDYYSERPDRRSKLILKRANLILDNEGRWVPSEVRLPYFEGGLLREVHLAGGAEGDVAQMQKLLSENPSIRFVVLNHNRSQRGLDAMRNAPAVSLKGATSSPGGEGPRIIARRNKKMLSVSFSPLMEDPGMMFGIYDSKGKFLRVLQIPTTRWQGLVPAEGLPEDIVIRVVGG